MSKNDITGDSLVNKPLSKQGEENWDRIFGKNKDPITKPFPHNILRQPRIDVIGQNGNDGDHYEYELNKSTGEVEKRFMDGVSKPNGEQFDE
jgi:hypothetical protein